MTSPLTLNLRKTYPSGTTVEAAFTARGVTCLFGPSGSGKTTLLRCVAGLESADGQVTLGPETWTSATPPQARRVGFLFQDFALFPHLTVEQNILFGAQTPAHHHHARELLHRFEIQSLASRYPRQISAGQAQRVALARALVPSPRVLLLDEPLSALDTVTRISVRTHLAQLLNELTAQGVITLLVTHDPADALALAQNLVVLNQGQVLQSAPLPEVFSNPASPEVAAILGLNSPA